MLRRKQGAVLTLTVLMGWFLLGGLAWADGGVGNDTNNHNAPYLRMGAGAPALGMGGAFVAVANDITAGYWNAAGLTWTSGWQIGGMYSAGMEVDRSYNQIGFARNADWGAYGLNWLNAGMSDITWRDADGKPTGTGDFGDNAIMLSLAKRFDIVSLGLTGKYLHQSLDADVPDDAVTGYGIDLGFGLALAEPFRVGVAVQDIAGELGSDDDANDLPTNLRAGVAVFPMRGLTGAFDVEKAQNDEDYKFHVGGEYAVPLAEDLGAAFRAGINDGDFAAGFGLHFNFLYVDYAFVNDRQDFLNENHRFSFALRFGQDEGGWVGMRDTDKDGIPDDVDQCPNLTEDLDGFMDTDGCPDADNDGDGVMDVNDNCPNQAEDMDGWQDADGCPDIDNDGDGILDKDDKCPNVAETSNGFEDDDGCPDDATPIIPIFAYINFKFGTAEITAADPIPVLLDVARIMKEKPDMKIGITGHTDNIGGDDSNLQLSMRRAEAVKTWLVEHGVGADRISTDGKGESSPIDTNDTDAGRARNRRIEFKVLD